MASHAVALTRRAPIRDRAWPDYQSGMASGFSIETPARTRGLARREVRWDTDRMFRRGAKPGSVLRSKQAL